MTQAKPLTPALLRLMTWLSPSFPVGAYSYSHGLEYAVEDKIVGDVSTLVDWVSRTLRHGNCRTDGVFFRLTHDAVSAADRAQLTWVLERAAIMRGTAETALETRQQGRAFIDAVTAVWPRPQLDALAALARDLDRPIAYPVAVATAAAGADIPLRPSLAAFLHATVANLVSAAIRLVPLGQTNGQRAMAALEQEIMHATDIVMTTRREDIGTATPLVDWASMRHETQYARLFRS